MRQFRPKASNGREVAVEDRPQRVGVQEVQVIRLHEGVDRQLPVGREAVLATLDLVVRAEAEGARAPSPPRRDPPRPGRAGREADVDEPGLLVHGKGSQPDARRARRRRTRPRRGWRRRARRGRSSTSGRGRRACARRGRSRSRRACRDAGTRSRTRAGGPVRLSPHDGGAPAGLEAEPVARLARVAAQAGEQRTAEEQRRRSRRRARPCWCSRPRGRGTCSARGRSTGAGGAPDARREARLRRRDPCASVFLTQVRIDCQGSETSSATITSVDHSGRIY